MYRIQIILVVFILSLTACNIAKTPNAENFTKAINDDLSKHGAACSAIGQSFPIDLSKSEQNERYGIGSKLAVLQRAGLVDVTDTKAVVHGMLDPLRGTGPAQSIRRYDLTAKGTKYIRQIPSALGQTNGFCYGQRSVDSIVRWAQPTTEGGSSQIEVTYTYKIVNAADWAERPDVQQAFPDIRSTFAGASKTTEVVGLQLTNRDWEVPEH